tara:strand:+ start:2678 stop:2854 length:177 start_codon:yes stop_codon:yes gene_type:complete
MHSKQNEIEAVIEDLIENTIIEAIAGSFSSVRECEVALEILKEKLDELDSSSFKSLFE